MRTLAAAAGALLAASLAAAHEHHNVTHIDPGVPIGAAMYVHMTLQTFTWGILFPIGMVLGLTKSRYHVPLQSVGIGLSLLGSYLGHHHGGREYPATVHGLMAKIIFVLLITQASLGIFLKLHILETTVRPHIRRAHKVVGVLYPIVGWTQMLFGVATALNFCRGGNLGQCAAHYIMGSAFIAYAAILVIMLNVGGAWLKRTGFSQEMLDSTVITVWGIVNTFTEHHGGPWTHKDMQHTMMGVLWWAGGMLGMFLSRKGQRSFVPAIIIVFTGWGMSAHEQDLMISSKIHALFGYALIAAGVLRVVEVCFVLHDAPSDSAHIRIFQHLPPYLLVLGGTLFISATNEEMHNANDLGIDHVSYALFDFSLSFLIYLIITFLVHLYQNTGRNAGTRSVESNAQEAGYSQLATRGGGDPDADGPEAYELTEHGSDDDAVKIGGEDEVDWIGNGEPHRGGGPLRL
ncbi:hypothetical protein Q8F55_001966 [Vanrija albida]|uniref:Cytochrome b561 domain-containing protein n=1 Tax=Vanrija albida TaxID=181172 RepID=A0ABR3Q8K5_9TREE